MSCAARITRSNGAPDHDGRTIPLRPISVLLNTGLEYGEVTASASVVAVDPVSTETVENGEVDAIFVALRTPVCVGREVAVDALDGGMVVVVVVDVDVVAVPAPGAALAAPDAPVASPKPGGNAGGFPVGG